MFVEKGMSTRKRTGTEVVKDMSVTILLNGMTSLSATIKTDIQSFRIAEIVGKQTFTLVAVTRAYNNVRFHLNSVKEGAFNRPV